MQMDTCLQGVRGLYPFDLVAFVNQIVRAGSAAASIQIGDRLVQQLEQIVVDLKLWIEIRSRRSDRFAVWNAAPVVHSEQNVHCLENFEHSLVLLVGKLVGA